MIERAYTRAASLGLAGWCEDEAGPFQAVPHSGSSWQPHGHPATQPHDYVRGGTCKLLTLFQPATGQVHLQPVRHGTNPILHGWLKERLTRILAARPAPTQAATPAALRVAWQVWQDGLTERFTLPARLPPLRLLLVWDNLTGHKSAAMVVWLGQHGIMPRYTPLGGSWLNMAESIQRVLKRRALQGQHPRSPVQIGAWFQQTARAWTQSRRPSPGTAAAGDADAIAPPRHIPSAAPPLIASDPYPALSLTYGNPRTQTK